MLNQKTKSKKDQSFISNTDIADETEFEKKQMNTLGDIFSQKYQNSKQPKSTLENYNSK